MKRIHIIFASAIFLMTLATHAQPYDLTWHSVDGGGRTSTGGVYSVSGTVGQPDAGGQMAGGNYALTGGFWSLISVLQSVDLPDLLISRSGTSVIVSWANNGSYTLQQNTDIAVTGGWVTSGYSITTLSGTNSITITSPTGKLFFRLRNP